MRNKQEQLVCVLEARGVDAVKVKAARDSGFYAMRLRNALSPQTPVNLTIRDSFYGNKQWSGHFTVEQFVEIANGGGPPFRALRPRFEIHSLTDAERILSEPQHARWRPRMSFRGQPQEYFLRRPFLNPVAAGTGADEPSLVPAFWRAFGNDWNSRPWYGPESIFTTIHGDPLIYHGLPDGATLAARNQQRYGFHTMSDLRELPDPESQEYGRRYWAFKILGIANRELPLVEQHYGISTTGLDVTFDLATALYFAAHEIEKQGDGRCCYRPAKSTRGIVYCFVYRDPPLTRTSDMWSKIESFAHLEPVRPLRQQCALPHFGTLGINEAAMDVHCILELAPDFQTGGLPEFDSLFPSPTEDSFYGGVLDVKRTMTDRMRGSGFRNPYAEIVEYVHP